MQLQAASQKMGIKDSLRDDNSSPPVAGEMQLHCLQGFTPSPAWKTSSRSSVLVEADADFLITCVVPLPPAKTASFWSLETLVTKAHKSHSLKLLFVPSIL